MAILADPEDHRIPSPAERRTDDMAEMLRGLERQLEGIDKQIVDWGREQRDLPASDHRSRLWADPVERHGGIRDQSRRSSAAGGLRRLARPGAAARRHGRQGEARSDQQARQWVSAPVAGQRRDVGAEQQASQAGPWLVKLLASKPRKVVAVALANKMARIGWALMMRQEDFRGRAGGGLNGCRAAGREACEGEHA